MAEEKLSGSLEENVLTLLVWDDENASVLAARLTEDIFSTRAYRDIAKVAISHLQRFNVAPAAHLPDMFEDKLRRGTDDAKLLAQTIEAMEKLAQNIQPEFVLAELEQFIESRQLSIALENAMELLQRGKLAEAQDAVHTVNSKRSSSQGIWLHDTAQSLSFFDINETDRLHSGVDILDERSFVPRRKALFLWMATAGAGKTWALINCGTANIMRGYDVLHISLEMPEADIAQRYVQNLFSIAKEEAQLVRVPKFERDGLGRCININFTEFDATALDPQRRSELEDKMQGLRNRGRLMIKDFPSGSLTTQQLDAYLDFLDRKFKFRPALIIVDYWDLFQLSGDNLRVDTGRIGVNLRGIAGNRNAAVVTATQGNRATATATTVRRQHVAEDWSKIATSDFVATYSQTEAEEELKLARIFTEKGRNVPQHYTVLISQAYAVGQFCIDAVIMDARLKEKAKSLAGED